MIRDRQRRQDGVVIGERKRHAQYVVRVVGVVLDGENSVLKTGQQCRIHLEGGRSRKNIVPRRNAERINGKVLFAAHNRIRENHRRIAARRAEIVRRARARDGRPPACFDEVKIGHPTGDCAQTGTRKRRESRHPRRKRGQESKGRHMSVPGRKRLRSASRGRLEVNVTVTGATGAAHSVIKRKRVARIS